jgi:hypothetical protein
MSNESQYSTGLGLVITAHPRIRTQGQVRVTAFAGLGFEVTAFAWIRISDLDSSPYLKKKNLL